MNTLTENPGSPATSKLRPAIAAGSARAWATADTSPSSSVRAAVRSAGVDPAGRAAKWAATVNRTGSTRRLSGASGVPLERDDVALEAGFGSDGLDAETNHVPPGRRLVAGAGELHGVEVGARGHGVTDHRHHLALQPVEHGRLSGSVRRRRRG